VACGLSCVNPVSKELACSMESSDQPDRRLLMHYRFQSKAAGDLLMTEPVGSELLRIIGKEPAPKGIIETAAMPSAVAAIERAIAREEAQPLQAVAEAATVSIELSRDETVTLRQRAWPLVEMMKRAQLEKANIVWGV
jgi:hypothetical protein